MPVVVALCMPLCAATMPVQDGMVTQGSAAAQKKKPLDMMLRSIAVLEWTGPEGKPTASWLVPVAVYTNGQYLDGDGYLAQPVPLAVQKGTQYILEKSGVPQGDYNLDAPRKLNEIWIGSGMWEPLQPIPSNSKTVGSGSPAGGQGLPTLHLRPPDPDRPHMTYGKPPTASQPAPSDLQALAAAPHQQMIAISDAVQRNGRPLVYTWRDEDQKKSMQQKFQTIAGEFLHQALQLKEKLEEGPNVLALPFRDVDFRCFNLTAEKKANEGTPTCIFSAENDPKSGPARYVTVIARPDIYGSPKPISHAITDATQLDAHPRVRLVDAVNATGEPPAELLFELDGQTARRFALYRITGTKIELMYVTGKLPR
ncbi:MAG: hypothetical protein WA708_08515 [Acidobacteriaceae bacterium]